MVSRSENHAFDAVSAVCLAILFQIILKIAGDTLVQMYTLVTCHVVTLTWICEEIRLCAGFRAGVEEHEAVLWHYRWVVHACYDLQAALEVLCLVEQ